MCLDQQIGHNVEAYIDDVVIKTKAADNLIVDLKLTIVWADCWFPHIVTFHKSCDLGDKRYVQSTCVSSVCCILIYYS